MAEHDAVTETVPDADLHLKKRARRRLVGAAALALLAVIVLPLVMDHEPRPPVQDIQMRIPAQDAGGITARLLPKKTTSTPLPVATPSPAVTAKTESKGEAVSAASAPVTPTAAPAVMPSAPSSSALVGAPATKSQAGQSVVAEKKSAADAVKPEQLSVADQKSTKEPSTQWVIQLGAYKEPGNTKHLLAKLKGVHVPAYTENLDTPQGPRVRVRAGPFASREAAEKARARVKIIGVDGPVAPK